MAGLAILGEISREDILMAQDACNMAIDRKFISVRREIWDFNVTDASMNYDQALQIIMQTT